MHIKKEDLTVVIVSYKSNQVIHNCIRSIENDIKIIIIDNANDLNLKKDIEEQHNNVKYILSNKNLGMGSGNNLGIKNVESDYVLILNPDVILEKNTISKLLEEAKLIKDFAIISPISIDLKYPNYKQIVDKNFNLNQPFRVKRVDGYSMMINLKRL